MTTPRDESIPERYDPIDITSVLYFKSRVHFMRINCSGGNMPFANEEIHGSSVFVY